MYIPKLFHESSWPEIRKVIEENSFATVITCNAGLPTATHVPLRLLESATGTAKLQGHMSRANPHWRLFEQEQQSLVIFSGPNAYVSARWYDHVNVPTWNYIAVHVYGKAQLVTDAGEMHELIKGLVDRYERGLYTVESLPEDFLGPQMKGIVGFEISVDEVQASFKLSQNRDQKNYDNVITELRKSDDTKAQDVAQIMASRRCPR
ncbi:MAG TPA: FMN-binding negative transcriptional regulator [Terriglobales bacterium]|nr:FMN-binding negative transcriptional regulator [Terriglobales bacterium]